MYVYTYVYTYVYFRKHVRDRVLPPLDLDSTCTVVHVQYNVWYCSVRKYFRTLKVLSYESTFVSISVLSSIYFRRLKFCYSTVQYTTVHVHVLYFVLSKVVVLSYFRKYNYNVRKYFRTFVRKYFRTKVRCTTTIMYESTFESTFVQINVRKYNVRKYESTFESTTTTLYESTTYESTFVRK